MSSGSLEVAYIVMRRNRLDGPLVSVLVRHSDEILAFPSLPFQ